MRPVSLGKPANASELEQWKKWTEACFAELERASYEEFARDAVDLTFTADGADAVQRTVASKLQDSVSVKDFGAAGDGSTDDTTTIQSAINAARTSGAAVYFPPGEYVVAGQLTLYKVALVGPGVFRRDVATYGLDGATLYFTGTTLSPLLIDQSGGVVIDGLNFFWPNQTTSTTPVAYPAMITCVASPPNYSMADVTFRNCAVINAYDFLRFPSTAHSMGDVRIESCRIFALRRTFWIEKAVPEVVYISNSMFSPGVYQNVAVFANSAYLRDWHAQNGTWLYVDIASGTIDGMRVSNTLVFGARYGIRLVSGGLFDFNGSNLSFDGVATALSVSGASALYGFTLTGGIHYLYQNDASGTPVQGIDINTTGDVRAAWNGVTFAYTSGSLMSVSGTGPSQISVTAGNIRDWGANATGDAYGIYVNAANAVVNFSPGVMFGAANGYSVACYVEGVNTMLIAGVHKNCKVSLLTSASLTSGQVKFNAQTAGTSYSTTLALAGSSGTVEAGPQAIIDKPDGNVAWPISSRRNATQTFGAGPTTAVFATVMKEYGITYSSGVFTVPVAGLYRFDLMFSHDASNATADVFDVYVESGGSSTRQWHTYETLPAAVGSFSLSAADYFAAGDTLAVKVARNSGSGNLVTVNAADTNNFTITKVA